jgi:hypothetical protein
VKYDILIAYEILIKLTRIIHAECNGNVIRMDPIQYTPHIDVSYLLPHMQNMKTIKILTAVNVLHTTAQN